MITNEYITNTNAPKESWVLIFKDGKKIARVLVDSSDTLRLREHRWGVRKPANSNPYSYCMECYNLAMHRYIAEAPSGMVVDHINHSTLDNRRANLRSVTHRQNMHNRFPDKNKVAGFDLPVSGVELMASGKWRATYFTDDFRARLGTFEHVYDACLARARYDYDRRGIYAPRHRKWIYKVPVEFKLTWFPEIFGPENTKFQGSALHEAFFYPKQHDLHDINIKLAVFRREYRKWKAASNV